MSTSAISTSTKPAKAVTQGAIGDVARGLSILLVLLVHCLVIFTYPGSGRPLDVPAFETSRVISTFIMPAFYFISGLSALGLASRSLRKITTSALRFILLAFVSQLMAAPLLFLAHPNMDWLTLSVKIIRPLLTGKDFILVVTWFFVSLAGVQVLAWLYLRQSLWIKLGVVAIVIAAYLMTTLTGKTWFMMHTWAIGLLFFLAGRAYAKRPVANLPPLYALAVSIISLFVLTLFYDLNKGCAFSPTEVCEIPSGYPRFYIDVVYGQFGFMPYFLLCAVIGIIGLMTLSMCLSHTKYAPNIARIGKNTLVLLMINGVFVALSPSLLADIIPTLPDTWILSVALVAAQVALYPIMSKPINNLLHMCSNWADKITHLVISKSPKPIQALLSK
ncbi:acyltransferase family protein [Asticcacaulis sp. ZE23SCel15]|uniref:acyltransferase family protein n=1 Tax=Asticcacaulis sp. ZE23SCel15 TaxID=3059027 RepID=UPI00265E0E07|nr:acyltransferase family protein [Asticcacaulis sp. ZE23SCel15]WKL57870.1 acyltransferase family protein [Asticcacaulis sp. ZE23SCel15]